MSYTNLPYSSLNQLRTSKDFKINIFVEYDQPAETKSSTLSCISTSTNDRIKLKYESNNSQHLMVTQQNCQQTYTLTLSEN